MTKKLTDIETAQKNFAEFRRRDPRGAEKISDLIDGKAKLGNDSRVISHFADEGAND